MCFLVSNVQFSWAAELVSTAATGAGFLEAPLPALFKALPLGSTALAQVPSIRTSVMVAAGTAVQQSCMHVVRAVALSSLSLGILAMIACICCNDMSEKVRHSNPVVSYGKSGRADFGGR